ncbi:Dynein heavy chain [Phytophthora palmivora]|uniref:Dynein heavy chain n=1 Tax=Phytophthora palmivora TaxID=4796 RepID=A0A2P4XFX7_9STRA|nr:Dynein heavy chain [Phytophthora palmivora]
MSTPRMQWVSQRIVESFEPNVTQAEVNEFLASGNTRKLFDELLSGKDATTADGKPVDVQKASVNAICFGELAPNILRDLETTISSSFSPLLKAKDEWGKADVDLKNEFMTESEKFANDLKEALNSMDSGLELRRPDRSIIVETVNNAGHADGTRALQIADSPKLIQHYEEVLKVWCDVISTYLETNTTNDGKGNNEQTIDDDGPMGELEYWRRRMQRLTSITEQLKMNEYKDVFAVLSRTTKSVNDDTKQRIQTLLRRWKQIDIGITEAANEAKDNVKYLFTLEKFIIPLYNGTPSSIIDTLPALMNSIKMIHSIARYYNTTERMANLFTKITNQMITNCKHCVTGGETYEVMWDKDPEELGKQFEFNEMKTFGKLEHFCRRGMGDLIAKFSSIIREFQYRNYDLLDYKNNRIFHNYGLELEHVLQQYEKYKQNSPNPRNLPPITGNITWSRHLLKRVEEPMKKFESNQNVLASKDAKRIIRTYNNVARRLVAFQYIWYQAWVQYIDTAKARLQATLIIRHPEDNKLNVNFDPEILQLLREAKCLDRMGIEFPEAAKIVLLQENKFKNYFNELQYALAEYDRIVTKVIQVTAMLL